MSESDEISRLKAENEGLTKQLEERKSTNAGWRAYEALKAEVEALRKDAERYRFIRKALLPGHTRAAICIAADDAVWILQGTDADEAIDAAMEDEGDD